MVKSRRWATSAPSNCPNCGSERVRPIIYGLPSVEGVEAAKRGEVVLGGCIVFDMAERWFCEACQRRFGLEVEPEPYQ